MAETMNSSGNSVEMPQTIKHLLDQLESMYPPVRPDITDLVDDKSRLELAWKIGQRSVVENLRRRLEKNKRK